MPGFDLSTAKPAGGFDLSSAKPVDRPFVGPEAPRPSAAKKLMNRVVPPGVGEFAWRNSLSMLRPEQRMLLESGLGLASAIPAGIVNEFAAGNAERRSPGGAQRLLENPPMSTYQPRTEEGKIGLGAAETVLSPITKAVDWAADTDNPEQGVRTTGHYLKGALGLASLRMPVRRAGVVEAPTAPELRARTSAAYKRAESTAGIVPNRSEIAKPSFDFGKMVEGQDPYVPAATTSGTSLQALTQRVQQALAEEKFTPNSHPKTADQLAVLNADVARPEIGQSFGGLEAIRKALSDRAWDAEMGSSDARLANRVLDQFDDWAESLKPEDMVGGVGDPQAAMAAFNEGRANWSRVKKTQTIETLVEKATNNAGNYAQSGLENALRRQFVTLANNANRMRQFNAAERAAIERIVRPTRVQRLMRGAGRFAVRGPMSAGLDLALGSGSPLAGMAIAGLGEAGRLAATLVMENKVGGLSEMVRGGGAAPAGPSTAPANALPPILFNQPAQKPDQPYPMLRQQR